MKGDQTMPAESLEGGINIKEQSELIRRIQADLRKEGNKRRGDGDGMAATVCEGQADALDAVLATLKGVEKEITTWEKILNEAQSKKQKTK